MKLIGIIASLLFVSQQANQCPHDKEIQCITDVNHAFDICDKAAKAQGKDQKADLNCIKYMAAMRSDCWPCICQIAKDNDYHIQGCS